MRIVQINSTCKSGSTGKICYAVSKLLNDNSIENYILYSCGTCEYNQAIKFSNKFYLKIQALKGRILGNNGFNSHLSTLKLIKELKKINPSIVHLHNLHSNDINLTMLFNFLKKKKIKIYYTFHDCWAFTAYCHYFTLLKCDKYKTGCHHCSYKRKASWLFDRSKTLYKKKKALFDGQNLTIIAPSNWLAKVVGESFLKKFPIKIIHNGIDLSIFKPHLFRISEKYGISSKTHIVLGVAFGWGVRKGLDVFLELSKRLASSYQIVLVGTDDKIDKALPNNIVSIHRTNNQEELAEIYSFADVFFNPTREENYPTVNMEALACGCPVVTFCTGGSPEIIDKKTGIDIPVDDIDASIKAIKDVCENRVINREDCIERANTFDMHDRYHEYIDLYRFM